MLRAALCTGCSSWLERCCLAGHGLFHMPTLQLPDGKASGTCKVPGKCDRRPVIHRQNLELVPESHKP